MTLEVSGTIKYCARIQYVCTLVRGEALCYFDTLSAEVGIANPENLTSIILGLGREFSLLMRCQIKITHSATGQGIHTV